VPYVEQALADTFPADTVLDGELIAANGWGGVQSVMTSGGEHVPGALSPALTFVCFDVLFMNGNDIRTLPWENRRALLEMVRGWPANTYLTPSGEVSEAAHVKLIDMGMEGSMLKLRTATYASGRRSQAWRKLKAIATEDCTIVGFEDGKNGRAGEVGAIVVELPSGVTTTASGMTDKERADMLAQPEKYLGKMVEIAHNGIMASGKPRHPRFKRMRDDRSPAPAPKPAAPPRRRATRSGPWMRNYKAMGDQKLLGCVRELAFASGDAYQRCIDHGADHRAHYKVAADEAMSRGLPVPAFPTT
jgi:ATP-dependent DNA ligase